MEKFKVKVTNKSEVLEIEKILSTIGMFSSDYSGFSYPKYIANNIDGEFSDYTVLDSGIDNFKLITIQELRDMVVLKRNDVADATHEDYSGLEHLLLTHTRHVWGGNMWLISSADFSKLKPIQKEKVMKEYLFKYNDQYTLVELSKEDAESNPEQYIEVPDGADVAVYPHFSKGISFFKNNFRFACADSSGEWKETDYCPENLKHWKSWRVAWQRHTQPEELPFVDSLPEFKHDFGAPSLNDQYVEIEQVQQAIKVESGSNSDHSLDAISFGFMGIGEDASHARKQTIEATLAERQAQYGDFKSVANTTGQLMAVILNSNNGKTLPYAHEEALHMICSKIARIMNGDYNHKDSWHDIGGYSKLIEDLL